MAKATCGLILANHISVFPIDLDKLPRYVGVRVMAFFCLCTAVFIKEVRLSWSQCTGLRQCFFSAVEVLHLFYYIENNQGSNKEKLYSVRNPWRTQAKVWG